MESMSAQIGAKSLNEVRRWFFDEGLTVVDWAHRHGFPPAAVYALLAGRTRGCRGQAHRAAVALGLKSSGQAGDDFRQVSCNELKREEESMPAG